jgi:hypothetical protein
LKDAHGGLLKGIRESKKIEDDEAFEEAIKKYVKIWLSEKGGEG